MEEEESYYNSFHCCSTCYVPGTQLTVLCKVPVHLFKNLCHGYYPHVKIRNPRFYAVIWFKYVYPENGRIKISFQVCLTTLRAFDHCFPIVKPKIYCNLVLISEDRNKNVANTLTKYISKWLTHSAGLIVLPCCVCFSVRLIQPRTS